MAWLVLTLLGVLVFSSTTLWHRLLMQDAQSDPYAQTVAFFGLAGTVACIAALLQGGVHYHLTPAQLGLFVPLAITTTMGPVLLFRSLQLLDASENAILQSSQLLWTVAGAFVVLGEPFSLRMLVGTVAVILGIAVARWQGGRFAFNRGVGFVLTATLFYSAADLISFVLVRDIDPLSLIVYVCWLPVVTLLVIRPKTARQLRFYGTPRYGLAITMVALCDAVGTLAIYSAYRLGRNAAQITPILGTITIVSVVMAIIVLRERSHLPTKLLGAAVAVSGAVVVL